MTPDENKQLVKGAYEALSSGNPQGFMAVLDPNIVVYEPDCLPYGGKTNNLQEFLGAIAKAGALVDASKMEVLDLIAEGDKVVARISMGVKGSDHVGDLAEIWTLKDGKAVEIRVYWDDPTVVPNA